jgi:hypothetical protein
MDMGKDAQSENRNRDAQRYHAGCPLRCSGKRDPALQRTGTPVTRYDSPVAVAEQLQYRL